MNSKTIVWTSGKQDFQQHTITYDVTTNSSSYKCHLSDAQIHYHTIIDAFMYHIEHRQGICELLYSGGLDSEIVLKFLLSQNIPTKVITLRLLKHNAPVNINDLYYSEKFCREHQIKQYFLNLDIEKFYNNYDYINFLDNYRINKFHVATHFWMIDQCDDFPIIGGEYPWPWETKPVISPFKHSYHCYDRYMKERNITGIGNMLGYSLDSMLVFMKEHMKHVTPNCGKLSLIPMFKEKMYNSLGLGDFELRQKSYGWDYLPEYIFNHKLHQSLLEKIYPEPHYSITWESKIAEIIASTDNYNDMF